MAFRSFSRLVLACLLTAVAGYPLLADNEPAKPAPTPQQRNLDSFDYVWKTVRDKHWDPKLNGLDWEAIRTELRPKAEKAETTSQARAVMSDMLKRLGQSHFSIIPRDVYDTLSKSPEPTAKADGNGKPAAEKKASKDDRVAGDGDSGIELRVVDGQALVTRVDDKSPAAKLGVKTGWIVAKVRGQELAKVIERAEKTYKGSTLLDLRLTRAVESRLSGRIGEEIPVVFRDGADQEVSLDIPLTRPRGRVASLGHMPGQYVWLEARRLEGNIGYIYLNAFFDPVNVRREFEQALWSKPLCTGMILDLRGNPGGIGPMAIGLGNLFIDKPNQKLGTLTLRNGTMHFVLNPQADTFAGPLAVLVDGCSASTSEILAGGLQDLKRARVFGTRTAGAALPSLIERLPNGDGFQFAIANYISVGGQVLEGTGVQPDVEVKPDRKVLLTGRDPVVDAALAWIKEQK
jgi:carboxyl-terminal processing protease